MLRLAVLIPFYNHHLALKKTLEALHGTPYLVLIINDGSDQHSFERLQELVQHSSLKIQVLTLKKNTGKGGAVKAGLAHLQGMEITHAFQIDADGQHELTKMDEFITRCEDAPQSIICGEPIFSNDIPKARLYGRYATHIWVWINTLSFTIKDSMCGFRIYPIQPINALLDQNSCGNRMEFDVELLVRSHWSNIQIVFIPIHVTYPEDGVSHFAPLRDNLLISFMHTRLFFGMLKRLPSILWHKYAGVTYDQ